MPESVGAVVSRGGRPDLAGDALPRVTAPTLLIVGGDDEIVLELNREAFDQLTCVRQLDIVPGATHLFAEPGALEEVARLAREWFLHYLTPAAADETTEHQDARRMTPADSGRQEEPRITRIHTNKKAGYPIRRLRRRDGSLMGLSRDSWFIRENSRYSWFLPFFPGPVVGRIDSRG